ncbi:MAG: radical SAM protein [Candidatus Hodarchaeota archaeon]
MDPQIFERKVELLFKGIKIIEEQPGDDAEAPSGPSNIKKVSRKGGAGPAGGFYARYHDYFQANIPLQEQMVKNSDLFMHDPTSAVKFQVFKKNKDGVLEEHVKLIKIPAPRFYNDEYVPKERLDVGKAIPFKKIALIHASDCVATTINQRCKYWKDGTQCLFCAIENSLEGGDTLQQKDPDALVEFTNRARKEGRVKHFTLTSGTQDDDYGGALEYVPFAERLKENFKYPIHVQVAPITKLEVLDKLYYAGVDNIGIHLEAYPERVRKTYCPGKSTIPMRLFEKNWDYSVDLFGSEQVESYLLVGLGETFEEFKQAVELMLSHEVIPFVVPARPIVNTKFEENQLEDYKILVDYYKYAGTRMHEQGLNPSKSNAGCVRCGGCSAIGEAVKAAQRFA